ncbi:hypothetical protein EIP86_002507 [Pleurotus ostreatoroseus]|nr:hypothetical protein EIP86_002507 [Pleurotus ostreatoroseus]
MAFAQKYEMRVVTVNWKDYPGSSAYSVEELERFKGDFETQCTAMEDEGRCIASFLRYFIESQKIPPLQFVEGKRKGGVTVLAWSLGNIFLLPFLAYAHRFEENIKSLLTRYLRTIVVFDPPIKALGQPIPEEFYVPFRDPAIPPQNLAQAFADWTSAYYSAISTLEGIIPANLSSEERKIDEMLTPTMSAMSPEARAECNVPSVLMGSAGLMLVHIPERVLWKQLEEALFDTKGVWPDVNVVHMWCDKSFSETIWGAKVVSDTISERQPNDTRVMRKVDVVKVENANHFVHWDDPERTLRLLAEYS